MSSPKLPDIDINLSPTAKAAIKLNTTAASTTKKQTKKTASKKSPKRKATTKRKSKSPAAKTKKSGLPSVSRKNSAADYDDLGPVPPSVSMAARVRKVYSATMAIATPENIWKYEQRKKKIEKKKKWRERMQRKLRKWKRERELRKHNQSDTENSDSCASHRRSHRPLRSRKSIDKSLDEAKARRNQKLEEVKKRRRAMLQKGFRRRKRNLLRRNKKIASRRGGIGSDIEGMSGSDTGHESEWSVVMDYMNDVHLLCSDSEVIPAHRARYRLGKVKRKTKNSKVLTVSKKQLDKMVITAAQEAQKRTQAKLESQIVMSPKGRKPWKSPKGLQEMKNFVKHTLEAKKQATGDDGAASKPKKPKKKIFGCRLR